MPATRRTIIIAGLAMLAVRPARAQAPWPTRLVRLISSSPPAGASDILSRTLANALQGQLGQSFMVENRPGGGGIIGADMVAKSAPDGYTWLTTAVASQAINATLLQQPYNPRKDFRHVTIIGRLPLVMLVNKDLPVASLKDYVALAKARPGKLNFGTGGVGTLHHLTGELLKLAAGIDIVHVPYRGTAPMLVAAIAGEVQVVADPSTTALPHIQDGRLRPIAIVGAERHRKLPDVPTTVETGHPKLDAPFWLGVVAPAGTPPAIIDKLNAAFRNALAAPETRARLDALGADVKIGTPDEFGQMLARERAKWTAVVKAANITKVE
jgi:tripartite-type tricarboxylate transporter receptor subunit TctC